MRRYFDYGFNTQKKYVKVTIEAILLDACDVHPEATYYTQVKLDNDEPRFLITKVYGSHTFNNLQEYAQSYFEMEDNKVFLIPQELYGEIVNEVRKEIPNVDLPGDTPIMIVPLGMVSDLYSTDLGICKISAILKNGKYKKYDDPDKGTLTFLECIKKHTPDNPLARALTSLYFKLEEELPKRLIADDETICKCIDLFSKSFLDEQSYIYNIYMADGSVRYQYFNNLNDFLKLKEECDELVFFQRRVIMKKSVIGSGRCHIGSLTTFKENPSAGKSCRFEFNEEDLEPLLEVADTLTAGREELVLW